MKKQYSTCAGVGDAESDFIITNFGESQNNHCGKEDHNIQGRYPWYHCQYQYKMQWQSLMQSKIIWSAVHRCVRGVPTQSSKAWNYTILSNATNRRLCQTRVWPLHRVYLDKTNEVAVWKTSFVLTGHKATQFSIFLFF